MHTPIPTLVGFRKTPWNKGRLIGQKRPLKPKEVWTIRVRLQLERRRRDLALFNLAIDSKLRGCDLVGLRVADVCVGGYVRDRATVIQQKTGRPVQFEITEQTRTAIRDWLTDCALGSGRFPSRVASTTTRTSQHGSTRGLSIAGSNEPDLIARLMGRTRCGAPRQHRFTRKRVISGLSSCCSAIRSWKARCAISASRWMTRLPFRSRSSCRLQ